ncbi:AAA family ATPase [Arthrobacter sp. I2-34]|uniref:AAA family ATPase n=1 Tax=Arthrobacter hankyongi TaxID=2904801 RepID=A0ABS9LDZ8_9MICC|nr:TOPRIM nucleotidyl transferase/hydrolase domain-containing protein [Arthrobacter hankyongi]MCG2624738.1 AAA family ATPase [Arthrobacter hankyongi]
MSIVVAPNPDYVIEIEAYLTNGEPKLLPVEYYSVEWRSFADEVITSRPKGLASALIDSRTVRSSSGVDFHLRQILSDHLDGAEKAEISLAYRRIKGEMSDTTLKNINAKMSAVHAELHDGLIGLSMDQTSRTSWESSIMPHVDEIPFAMTGQGQQAAIKIALAMNRTAKSTNIVMIEEPENHLSHTSLNKLVGRIKELSGEHQQLFITTHSSFVLNRLGLDALLLVSGGRHTRLGALDPNTVAYFEKLPGYDTLRMALADKVVLVEGPSDEILFERFYVDMFGHRPIEDGIDVVSMRGLSLARCLELCAALDKPVAATRDNDGEDPTSLSDGLTAWLTEDRRRLFIGAVEMGTTLEPQLISQNDEGLLRSVLGISDRATLGTWMSNNKTEAAIRIAKSAETVTAPLYFQEAAKFIHDA